VQLEALLCDAATVRESLLHILGGGITNISRASYPAPLGVAVAAMFIVHPSEAVEQHRLKVLVQSADGTRIAEIDGEFGVASSPDMQPGQMISAPLVIGLQQVPIPTPGSYSVELLIDNQLAKSFPVQAIAAASA